MPLLELKIELSDATAGLIDALRLSKTREDIVRQLLELGLCEMLEATARTHRDATLLSFMGQTEDLKLSRNNLLKVKAPRAANQEADEADVGNVRRYETLSARTSRS